MYTYTGPCPPAHAHDIDGSTKSTAHNNNGGRRTETSSTGRISWDSWETAQRATWHVSDAHARIHSVVWCLLVAMSTSISTSAAAPMSLSLSGLVNVSTLETILSSLLSKLEQQSLLIHDLQAQMETRATVQTVERLNQR